MIYEAPQHYYVIGIITGWVLHAVYKLIFDSLKKLSLPGKPNV
jgi:hypothetical protein